MFVASVSLAIFRVLIALYDITVLVSHELKVMAVSLVSTTVEIEIFCTCAIECHILAYLRKVEITAKEHDTCCNWWWERTVINGFR
jgi:hypothetical protein